MSRLQKNDPLAVCPYYDGHTDHLIVCRDENVRQKNVRAFEQVTECLEHREKFCRCLKWYQRCPIYTDISERDTIR